MIIPGFRGINNRLPDTALPGPSRDQPFYTLRNAVNVDIDNFGNVYLPRPGFLQSYTGTDVHSWFEFEDAFGYGLFVDDIALKRYNLDGTTTVLQPVNALPMSFTVLNGTVYFSNGVDAGRYINGTIRQWGVMNPPRQPTATATTFGNLYAGTYKVAITWLYGSDEHYQESGTFESTVVDVVEGGGIRLTNFPSITTYAYNTVDRVAVWVSSVNGDTLFLYDEYPADVDEVFLGHHIGTVPLETQFKVKPEPKLGLTVHNGGIFWKDGTLVKYTEAHNVGLYKAGNFFDLEDTVINIISIKTGPLYVQTTKGIYAINGVYNPDTPAQPLKTRSYSGAEGAVCYSPDYNEAYLFSDRGFTKITSEGITDLNFTDVAPPHFEKGTISYVEQNGIRKLIFVGQNPVISSLQHPDYSADEIARKGSAV